VDCGGNWVVDSRVVGVLVSDIAALSPRQLEIAKLFAAGHSTSEVAKILLRSTKTIETHRATIRHKMQISTGVQWMDFLRSVHSEEAK
jgi:DNA-binding CsgD family transcriptional regulator